MCQSGSGRGVLLPSGKHSPSIEVDYDIANFVDEKKEANGMRILQKRAAVKALSSEGHAIPLGDFDLIIDDEIIRLKHVEDDPEWLVLSSQA